METINVLYKNSLFIDIPGIIVLYSFPKTLPSKKEKKEHVNKTPTILTPGPCLSMQLPALLSKSQLPY
jgi:hypothetical protein